MASCLVKPALFLDFQWLIFFAKNWFTNFRRKCTPRLSYTFLCHLVLLCFKFLTSNFGENLVINSNRNPSCAWHLLVLEYRDDTKSVLNKGALALNIPIRIANTTSVSYKKSESNAVRWKKDYEQIKVKFKKTS